MSADSWNGHASTVTVLPITRSLPDFPTRIEVEATAGSGLGVAFYARCEDIRAISERRLLRALGRVDPLVMLSVSRTLPLCLDT